MRALPPLFTALEPRALLAGVRTITDLDGDVVRVSVIGAGDLAITASAGGDLGFLDSVIVSNTNATSKLEFKLINPAGNSRINLRQLSVLNPIRSIDALPVDAISGAQVYIEDVGQLRWGNVGDNIAQFQIGTAPSVLNLGPRTVQFGNVGGGSGLVFNTRLKSATFGTVGGNSLSFLGGVDKVKSLGDLQTRFFNGASNAEIREIDVVGALEAAGNITGDVKSIKAGSIENANNQFLETSGSFGSISIKRDINGLLRANNYGSVSGNDFTGKLEYRLGAGVNNLGFKSIKFTGGYDGGTIAPAIGGTPAFISSFSTNSFSGGFIHGSGGGSFNVTGNLLNSDILLDGVATGLTLKTFTVGGQAGGDLTVEGHAGAIKFGYSTVAAPFTITDGPANASFGSIGLTSKLFDSKLTVDVGYVDSFTAAGGLINSEFVFNPIAGAVTKKFIAGGTFNNVTIDAPSTFGINTFQALGTINSDIDVGYINSLTMGFGNAGGIRNTDFNFSGQSPQGFSLRTAKIGETFESSSSFNVVGAGKLGSLTSRRYFNSEITAPTIDSILATGVPNEAFGSMSVWATSNPLNGFSIKTIDIRGLATDSDIGAAGSIDRIRINCIHALVNSQKFRVSAGNVMTPSSMPGDLSGFATGAKINSIDIINKFDANRDDFNSAFFVAPSIGKIKVDGLINFTGINDGGQAYGFGAASFGQIKIKDKLGGNLTLIDPPLGFTNPVESEALSNFRIARYPL